MDQLFYSRRIGLHEGEIVPIWAGVRLVGRAGKHDIGVMNMQTGGHEYNYGNTDSVASIPSTNFGVYRLRKQVLNPRSYLGGMITSKVDVDGKFNINGAVDGIFSLFRNDYLTFNYIQTFDSDVTYDKNFFDHGKFYLNWENRSDVGLGYEFFISRSGEYYNPEMGFELMKDYSRAYGRLSYGWIYNQVEKKILSQNINADIYENRRNSDWATEIRTITGGYDLSMKSGFGFNVTVGDTYEFLEDTFNLSDEVYFHAGTYHYSIFETSFSTPSNKLISLRAGAGAGTYYDGKILNLGPARISIRPSSSVNIDLDYQYNQISVNERDQHFKSHLIRLRTDFTFTTKLFLSMFFQYSSNDKFGVNNIRFRYNPKEGNDLYIVYNDQYNTYLEREIPNLPFYDFRKIIIKYTYTFIVSNRRKK